MNNLPTSFDLCTIIHFFPFKKKVNDKHLLNVISHLQTRLNLWGVVFFWWFHTGQNRHNIWLKFQINLPSKEIRIGTKLYRALVTQYICNEKQVIFRDYICFKNSPIEQFTNRDHLQKIDQNIKLKIPHKTQGLLGLSIISLAKQFQSFPIQF